MFSRISELTQYIAEKTLTFIAKVFIYFHKDVILLDENSKKNSHGIATARLGPKLFNHQIVMLTSILPTDNALKHAKTIMDLEDDDARKHYRFMSYITGANLFIPMNNHKGIRLRKEIIPYLHRKRLHIDFNQELTVLFKRLQSNVNSTEIDNYQILSMHILDLITRELLGFKLNHAMRNSLVILEKSAGWLMFIFALLPEKIIPLIPQVRRLRYEFDNNAKVFLKEFILNIKQNRSVDIPSNWLTDIIERKYQKKIQELTDLDIADISINPDIRVCFAIIFGATNTISSMIILFKKIYQLENVSLIKRLHTEINVNKRLTDDCVMNEKQMPLLHATYLETLRHVGEKFVITRYSKHGLLLDDLVIPPQSQIILRFNGGSAMYHSIQYPADKFLPDRFFHKKNQCGFFKPFGLGKRPCPGEKMAELILKQYLAGFMQHVSYFDRHSIFFRPNSPMMDQSEQKIPCATPVVMKK